MQLILPKNLTFLALLSLLIVETKYAAKLLPRRNRSMLRRIEGSRENVKPKICFDLVGCFADPPPHLTLKRAPQDPSVIQTRFLLYTRSKRDHPDSLQYGDGFKSMLRSRFDPMKPLKVIVHGYKGSGSDTGAILLAQAFLDVEDANVLVLDWTRGAATTYSAAVANTELVGRQLGLVILDAINLGTIAANVHIIGFSLGAHVAGCASEVLKKQNLLPGRITGLDPASPFFRNHLFREKSRKLDATDAQLVDVIHTDGSEDFADGFGLLKPLGHIDFFPNGGREQPGCNDVKNSVVVSHMKENMLTREIACSHLRAWEYFLESVRMANESCKFFAWPCSRGQMSYANGVCFPLESTLWSQEMGYRASHGPLGIYYLPTRDEIPFCGQPLRASVIISEGTPKISGTLYVKIMDGHDSSITFKFRHASLTWKNKEMTLHKIAAAKFPLFSNYSSTIQAWVWYYKDEDQLKKDMIKKPNVDTLYIHKIAIENRVGNIWEYCHPNTAINLEKKLVILR